MGCIISLWAVAAVNWDDKCNYGHDEGGSSAHLCAMLIVIAQHMIVIAQHCVHGWETDRKSKKAPKCQNIF